MTSNRRSKGRPVDGTDTSGFCNAEFFVPLKPQSQWPAALALRPAWDATGTFRWVEQIGSQTQRPLAIVIVGGMLTTLVVTRYLMPVLYSFYGHRARPTETTGLTH